MTIPVFLFALGILAAFTVGSTVDMAVNQNGQSVAVVCLLWWNWLLFGLSFLSAFETGSSGVALAVGSAGLTVSAISYMRPDMTLLPGVGLWTALSVLYMACAGHLVGFVMEQWRIMRGKRESAINPRKASAGKSKRASGGGEAKADKSLPKVEKPQAETQILSPERIAKPTSDPTGRLGLAAALKKTVSAAEAEAAMLKKREENVLTKPDHGISMGIKRDSGGSGE